MTVPCNTLFFMALKASAVNPGDPSITSYHFLIVLGCDNKFLKFLRTYEYALAE